MCSIGVKGRNNITIRNCGITPGNFAFGGGSNGISFVSTDNSLIENNIISTNGTVSNFGISLIVNSDNNTVRTNNIFTEA